MFNALSILSVTLIGYSFSNYTFNEFDNHLMTSSDFNFSIFAQDPIGIMIYGIDPFNKFLIEIESRNKEKKFILKINKFIRKVSSENICGCGNCTDIYMTFIIRILQSNIVIKCRNYETSVYLNGSFNQDQWELYPKPKGYSKGNNRSSIWIGNIGYYTGDGNIKTLPNRNQMIGCVDKFYFNDEQISLTGYGDKVLSSCFNEYIEISGDSIHQKNISLIPLVNNCAISVLNFKYCNKDLPTFKEPYQIYIKDHDSKWTLVLKLIWKPKYSKNFCLIELKINESYYVLFTINQENKIAMTIVNNNQSQSRDLFGVAFHSTNVLLLTYQYSLFTIRIGSHNVIKRFTRIQSEIPNMVNIGSSNSSNICETYEGTLLFQHEVTNLLKMNRESLPKTLKEYQNWFILEFAAFVVLLLIIIFFLVKYKILPRFKKMETIEIQNRRMPPVIAPNINDYDYEQYSVDDYAEIKI